MIIYLQDSIYINYLIIYAKKQEINKKEKAKMENKTVKLVQKQINRQKGKCC